MRCNISKPVKTVQLYEALNKALVGSSSFVRARRKVQSQFDKITPGTVPLRILLAEDNTINQRVALRILQRLGYTADVADTGLAVLNALDENEYDVILMDVQMPELNGSTQHAASGPNCRLTASPILSPLPPTQRQAFRTSAWPAA